MPRRSASATASASSGISPIVDPGPLEEEQQPAPASAAPRKRAASRGKSKGPAVNTEALAEITKLGVGALSYVLGLVAAAPDMALAEDLSMTREEAEQIGVPLANILSHTQLIKKYAGAINNGNDYVQLAGGVFDYGTRFAGVYFARRPIRARSQQVSQASQPAGGYPVAGSPVAGSNGHQPTYDGIPAHLLAS